MTNDSNKSKREKYLKGFTSYKSNSNSNSNQVRTVLAGKSNYKICCIAYVFINEMNGNR